MIAEDLPSPPRRQGGVRHLLGNPTVRRVLSDRRLAVAIRDVVDEPLVAVKATLFDKTALANWHVQWHQDRVISVAERLDISGYGPWTIKKGVHHVEAPQRVLEQMVAIRIHLDQSSLANGPLRVIPGSHRLGKLAEAKIATLVASSDQIHLSLQQGSILLMRPLLLHASSPTANPAHRRVLHVELAPQSAIAPLLWHELIELPAA
jgi:ectoine hydroxylase-related dioxygenase (phytanoyl-CoA dioxygenase family)